MAHRSKSTFADQSAGQYIVESLEDRTLLSGISISGHMYVDANNNGILDPGETVMPGVTLYADMNSNNRYDPTDPVATTDAGGAYTFQNIALNGSSSFPSVQLIILKGVSGYRPDSVNKYFYLNFGNSVDFTFAPSVNHIHISVFADPNGSGTLDASQGEAPLADVTFFVDLNDNGELDTGEPSAVSVDRNIYFSTNVDLAFSAPTGTYRIVCLPPAGYEIEPGTESCGSISRRYTTRGPTP